MAVLTWGKPTIQIKELPSGEWQTIDTPVDGTTTLETSEGDKTEATEEGGGVVDTYRKKNKYTLSFELFIKRESTKPIDDEDGVISTNYAVRLIPEDKTLKGLYIPKASASVQETWTSADGGRWKYTFDALVPDSGKMLQQFQGLSASPNSVTFDADGESKTITISNADSLATGDIDIPSGATWLSKSLSGTTLTLTASAQSSGGAERSAVVTITNNGQTITINAKQEADTE